MKIMRAYEEENVDVNVSEDLKQLKDQTNHRLGNF